MWEWREETAETDLSFLPEGNFKMEAYQDGVNTDRMASDYRKTTQQVNKVMKLRVHLAPGGGWAAHILPSSGGSSSSKD